MNYVRAAENLALLAAHGAGLALPISPAVGLVRALLGTGPEPAAQAFVDQVLSDLSDWCAERKTQIDEIGGISSDWDQALVNELATGPPADPAAARELLMKTLFQPRFASTAPAYEALAGELAVEWPKLILRAGDRFGSLGALRALAASDTARLEALVRRLDPDQQHDADPAIVTAYLSNLIEHLNIDRWSAREGAAPTALSAIQQSLQVKTMLGRVEHAPIQELAQQCDRLVVLGGPGTGKTWSARRIAIRAAENARNQLAAGSDIDSVELPLFAACSEVLGTGGLPWTRLIDATLTWAHTNLGDATRLRQVLHAHERVLIILDGLDEAADYSRDAIHQLVDVRPSWSLAPIRLLLTSRPGAWNPGLLSIDDNNERHQVGYLEPFTDDDIRAAVRAWLHDDADARQLILGLLERPNSSLGRQAKVPLLCAMFCLVARAGFGTAENARGLFESGQRLALYDTAIRKLLFADWRDRTHWPSKGTVKDAERWLECLAETGNETDSVTGLGTWQEDIEPDDDPPPKAAACVDHVAPLNPRRSGEFETRRFIHRTLREHLTAKDLNRQNAAVVAEKLLPHLWYDPAWAEVIPAVIAGHPHADDLVTELVGHVEAITSNDPDHALDDALVKAAALTTSDPATPRRTSAINDAFTSTRNRTFLTDWGERFAETLHWEANTASARAAILTNLLFRDDLTPRQSSGLAVSLAALRPAPNVIARAAKRLLRLLLAHGIDTDGDGTDAITTLVDGLVALAPAREQIDQAVSRLLALLDTPNLYDGYLWDLTMALTRLRPSPPQAQRAISRILPFIERPRPGTHIDLAQVLMDLNPTAEQIQRETDRIVVTLESDSLSPSDAAIMADVLVELNPTPEQTGRASASLLAVLDSHGPSDTSYLAKSLVKLRATSQEIEHASDRILKLLLDTADLDANTAANIAEGLMTLSPTAEQLRRAATRLLTILGSQDLEPRTAERLTKALLLLRPTPEAAQSAVDRLLILLGRADIKASGAEALIKGLLALGPTPQQRRCARHLLIAPTDVVDIEPYEAMQFARLLVKVGPTRQQTRHVTNRLLGLLDKRDLTPVGVMHLCDGVGALGSGLNETRQAADRLVGLLEYPNTTLGAPQAYVLADALVRLSPTSGQMQHAINWFIKVLGDNEHTPFETVKLTQGLTTLRRHLRQSLSFEDWAIAMAATG